MSKIEELVSAAKLGEMLGKKEEPKKQCKPVLYVLAAVGVIAAVAAIAYAVYRYFTPNDAEDFEDDFEDEFEDGEDEEDDFFVDEGDN